jgi:hypothetical protein
MAQSNTASAKSGTWWPWLAPWTMPTPGAAVPWFGLAPQQLDQAINPGWSFGNIVSVTNVNSTAPDVEQAILAHHSYGRQIGRMMDALAALVEAMPGKNKDKRIEAFLKIAHDVDDIKRRAEAPQVERLRAELEDIRRNDPKAWAELSRLLERN